MKIQSHSSRWGRNCQILLKVTVKHQSHAHLTLHLSMLSFENFNRNRYTYERSIQKSLLVDYFQITSAPLCFRNDFTHNRYSLDSRTTLRRFLSFQDSFILQARFIAATPNLQKLVDTNNEEISENVCGRSI